MEPGPAPGWGHSTEPPSTSVALGTSRLSAPMVPRPVGSPRGLAAAPRAVPPPASHLLVPKNDPPGAVQGGLEGEAAHVLLALQVHLVPLHHEHRPWGQSRAAHPLASPHPVRPYKPLYHCVPNPSSPIPSTSPCQAPQPPLPKPTRHTPRYQTSPAAPSPFPTHLHPFFFWVGELRFAQFGGGVSAHRCPGTGRWSCGSSWG